MTIHFIFATCFKDHNSMESPKLEIGRSGFYQSDGKILIDINDIPYPTAVYFIDNDEVALNRCAYEILGMKDNAVFDLNSWRKINPYVEDILKKIPPGIVTDKKIHVILFNGKHEIMNYSFSCFSNPLIGKITIIHFSKASEKYSVASLSSLYSIREELTKLKPYLNRPGKIIHDEIMTKYFREGNQKLTLDDLVYYEKELRIIQRTYPSLSHREVILCGLLVNDVDSKDIAVITNRSLVSVFVTIHRINKKLGILNKKELIIMLKNLVRKKEKQHKITIAGS